MSPGTTWTTEAAWRRSSKCSIGSCVEVLVTEHRVFIRDSKQSHLGEQPKICITREVWQTFLDELLGRVSPGSNGSLTADRLADGWIALTDSTTGISLSYDAEEWIAFIQGVELGELAAPLPA